MVIDKELLDKLLPKYEKPEDLIGENGLLRQLTKALTERALEPRWRRILAIRNMILETSQAKTAAMEKAKRR